MLKFNYFHFHLSDDQGFRAEIKKHPELSLVGGSREGSHFGKKKMTTAFTVIFILGHS